MTDDKIGKDTARDPEREALGPMRGGIRAAAKSAARKVAKKVAKNTGQKKTAKKSTAAGSRTTKKVAKSASKTDKSAPAKVTAPAPKATPARISVARSKAAAAKTDAAAARTATAASKAAIALEATSVGATAASESAASMPAAAPFPESGSSIESPRPPAPMHPGASMDSMQEHAGGLGGLLALWGPLIIVGFLVLVFRGGEERESAVATDPDAPGRAATGAPAEAARELQAGGAVGLTTGALPSERTPGPSGATHGAAEAFDGRFTMRTSMASPPAFADLGPGAGMRAVASGRIYPSPPGPYRDPRYRGLPTGESWPAAGAGEWLWPADGREGPGQKDGRDAAAVQWVRCAPPYYWCPAPSSPAW